MSKLNKFLTIFTIVACFILLGTNLTFALLLDKHENSGIIQFNQHMLEINIVENNSIILEPKELVLGANAIRTLNIKNPDNSTSCVMRMWLEFYVEGEKNETYLTLSLNEANYTKSESGKFYYNNVLNTGAQLNNIVLNFKVSESENVKQYEGKDYSIRLFIESIQANKEAVLDWSTDYTTEWLAKVYTNLS